MRTRRSPRNQDRLWRAIGTELTVRGRLLAVVEDARGHLRVALTQAVPADDEIIMGHVRDALALLEKL